MTTNSVHPINLHPNPIQPGDTIAIIAPSSPFDPERFDRGCALLRDRGYDLLIASDIASRDSYLAGSDSRRLDELNRYAKDSRVKAVIAVRGGYGAMRLLSRIDYQAIRRYPKLWIGFSDITALHSAIHRKTGLTTIHGPQLTSLPEAPKSVRKRFFAMIEKTDSAGNLFASPSLIWKSGEAEGKLIPANLTLLCHLMGTPFAPHFDDAILAVEDVGEAPYRVDRMLTQLELAGVFERVSGIVAGRFVLPKDEEGEGNRRIESLFVELAKRYELPLLGDAPFGHIDDNHPLPVGCQVRLDAVNGNLELLESPIADR